MKTQSFLSRLAVLGVAATAAGLACDISALALFSGAAAVFLLLVVTHDYGRTPARIHAAGGLIADRSLS